MSFTRRVYDRDLRVAELTPPLSAEDHVDGPAGPSSSWSCTGTSSAPTRRRPTRSCAASATSSPAASSSPSATSRSETSTPTPSARPRPPRRRQRRGRSGRCTTALFESRGALGREDLVHHARELGLDADRVVAELDSGHHASRVQRDVDSGLAGGVTGTPGFFVGGRFFGGSYDGASLITALEASVGPLIRAQ